MPAVEAISQSESRQDTRGTSGRRREGGSRNRSASPKFRRRPTRRKCAPNITRSGCRSSASKDAAIDGEGNAHPRCARVSGGGRPKLVCRRISTRYFRKAPRHGEGKDGAISRARHRDDSRGLAALLSLIKAMNTNEIATVGDIMFVGTSARRSSAISAASRRCSAITKDIDGFISIDGLGITRIVNQATGSHRYEFIFTGPGGHSFQELACRARSTPWAAAIAKISELQTPADRGPPSRRHRDRRHLGQCDAAEPGWR